MIGCNGGLIGSRRVPGPNNGPGIWTANEQVVMKRANAWINDPYFSNVSLLLHMDGSNGSTTFADSSSNALAVTANGNAQISTTQSKFGGASGSFDGTGDYLSIATTSQFAFAGDFTIEFWLYLVALNGAGDGSYIADFRSGGTSNFTIGVINSAGQGKMYCFVNGADATGTSQVTLNTWKHLAYCRSGSTLTLYLDGVSNGTLAATYSQPSTSTIIGSRYTGGTEFVNGYIDDLRITKGVARYTANFTPPTGPFPNS